VEGVFNTVYTMKEIVVGIADLKVSRHSDEVMVTYALGSCVAVAAYDPVARVGGLLHFMLPSSSLNVSKARENPSMFADTGLPVLFKSCYELGADKRRMVVKIAGGANIIGNASFFRVGQKNLTTLRKILWRNGILVSGEDTGSNANRTLQFHIKDGRVLVRKSGGSSEAI
jgi:chemotaxis protein CheD